VVFPPVADVVRAAPDAELSLSVDGPFADALIGEDNNLVLRAARALAALRDAGRAGSPPSFPRKRESRNLHAVPAPVDARPRRYDEQGAQLRLTKNLPVASGIGGGSADAAAALRGLCRLWAIAPDPMELASLALSLGADVPACLRSQPARMGGIGEQLTPSPVLPDCGIVLVNPGVRVATSDVFRARRGEFTAPALLPSTWPDAATMAADLGRMRNDLEQPAVDLCPAIASALSALQGEPGCLLARMSGSGATCFGLFDNPAAAERAAAGVSRSGWWSWGGAAQ